MFSGETEQALGEEAQSSTGTGTGTGMARVVESCLRQGWGPGFLVASDPPSLGDFRL